MRSVILSPAPAPAPAHAPAPALALVLGLSLLLLLSPVQPARAQSPVVVELFTSQGCSACPPADELLADLARRDDVIALALHVDYWDYIGWADTFASPQFTLRQHAYARAEGHSMVYTPQMIIGGVTRVLGHEPMRVTELVMEQRDIEYPVEVRLSRGDDGAIHLRAEASMAFDGPQMVVQVVRYQPQGIVEIRRGENAGRRMEYANIVTEWTQVSEWSGAEPFALDFDDESPQSIVVLVQMAGPGQILGAARLD
ncbi:MAG: DUF1223 domain-containing protein [Rhodobacteraceae bacterium CG17_big_fil_post_rev_8_21_14_2_50_65_11]|nr:MAG: DUF1223 domain-containing protein [Rhodobacteraceae bacterium CG17_big_fil_post_rev_8_21_14_2_50_65_11]